MRRLAVAGLVGVVLTMTVAACDSGDLSVENDSSGTVTVLIDDNETEELPATSGVVIMDYGCTEGDVTVEFESGEVVVLPGPVCPDQRVVIRDGSATLQPVSAPPTPGQ